MPRSAVTILYMLMCVGGCVSSVSCMYQRHHETWDGPCGELSESCCGVPNTAYRTQSTPIAVAIISLGMVSIFLPIILASVACQSVNPTHCRDGRCDAFPLLGSFYNNGSQPAAARGGQ